MSDETKPRRQWRVTKADLEVQIVAAAQAAEARAWETETLRRAIHAANIRSGNYWSRGNRWRLAALAGWAAFAVAVVW